MSNRIHRCRPFLSRRFLNLLFSCCRRRLLLLRGNGGEQARSDTLYCFDFLELLEVGVQEQWAAYAKERPQVTDEYQSIFAPASRSAVR